MIQRSLDQTGNLCVGRPHLIFLSISGLVIVCWRRWGGEAFLQITELPLLRFCIVLPRNLPSFPPNMICTSPNSRQIPGQHYKLEGSIYVSSYIMWPTVYMYNYVRWHYYYTSLLTYLVQTLHYRFLKEDTSNSHMFHLELVSFEYKFVSILWITKIDCSVYFCINHLTLAGSIIPVHS